MTYQILLTGANRGLGLAIASEILQRGHRLHGFIRNESPQLLGLRKRYPDALSLYSCDLSDESSIRLAARELADQVGTLDIVLNNAAVHLDQNRPALEQVDFSVYLPSYLVNAVAPLMVIKHVLHLLRKGKRKLIVNFSSEAGSIGACGRKSEYAYCMSKAALNMASRILQNSLGDEGIQVLALHPGWFSSDMGGPEAPISPTLAAEQVVKLILDPGNVTRPIFVDPSGNEMEW